LKTFKIIPTITTRKADNHGQLSPTLPTAARSSRLQ
jgi:hypothetical protein